jgi:phosphoenolpyruvate-protein phosphotransferase (PTS system enzyme I)
LKEIRTLKGVGVGLRAQRGEVFTVQKSAPNSKPNPEPEDFQEEKRALQRGISKVSFQLNQLQQQAEPTARDVLIALDLMLNDVSLREKAEQEILLGSSASEAFFAAVREFEELVSPDPVLMERAADLRDLADQVSAAISGVTTSLVLPEKGELVLVATDISAIEIMQFTPAVVGVITQFGGPTSHAAIMCRALDIPMLVACSEASQLLSGEAVLLDPVADRVVVGGSYELSTQPMSFRARMPEPLIPVLANIGSMEDASLATTSRANGTGLVRTEMLFMGRSQRPTIDEQALIYGKLLERCPAGPTVMRTFDVSEDKPVAFLTERRTDNRSWNELGEELIAEQLTSLAQLQLTLGKEIWVMAPMVSDARQALEFIQLARSIGDFRIGVMVEVATLIKDLAQLQGKLDFISVGTNDLLNSLMKTDRLNPADLSLTSHWQPSLIAALAEIARVCSDAGIHSGVCGESASDPAFSVVLAGLGFDSVSASPSQVGQVRAALSSLSSSQAREVAAAAQLGLSADQAKTLALAKLAGFQG